VLSIFPKKRGNMPKAKMITTTITRTAFAEKMKQVAESGYFYEYKCINPFWTGRIEGVKPPAEIIFLVGASPYRFTVVSIDKVEISTIPEYAREIMLEISKAQGLTVMYVYSIKCKPIVVPRGAAPPKQLQIDSFSSATVEPDCVEV
jgi:hypothetical protein